MDFRLFAVAALYIYPPRVQIVFLHMVYAKAPLRGPLLPILLIVAAGRGFVTTGLAGVTTLAGVASLAASAARLLVSVHIIIPFAVLILRPV